MLLCGYHLGIVDVDIFVEEFDPDGGTAIVIEFVFYVSIDDACFSGGGIPNNYYFHDQGFVHFVYFCGLRFIFKLK